MIRTIFIAAGGTGGHVFPALAVANQLKQINGDFNIIWIGGVRGLENDLVPKHGYKLEQLSIKGFRNKGFVSFFSMPVMLLKAWLKSVKLIFKYNPDIVIGFGGYASFPVSFVAWVFKIPVVIHEQNSVAGLSNKLLSKITKKNLVAFKNVLVSPKTFVVGNPVRQEIIDIPEVEPRYHTRSGKLKILVLGGSLGAKVLNDLLPDVFSKLSNIDSIVHQVGRGDASLVSQNYLNSLKNNGITYTVVPFIENMGKEFAKCDIVISRSGASTVSEICACGVASILVPYPYAVDDHQRFNAKPLADCGAAHLLLQSELSVNLLIDILANLDRDKCIDMATKARRLGIRDSTTQICQHIMEIIKEDD